MKAYTLRLDDERAKLLKHLSIEEGRSIKDILVNLIDIYIESRKETLEILSKKGWVESIQRGLEDLKKKRLVSHKNIKKEIDLED